MTLLVQICESLFVVYSEITGRFIEESNLIKNLVNIPKKMGNNQQKELDKALGNALSFVGDDSGFFEDIYSWTKEVLARKDYEYYFDCLNSLFNKQNFYAGFSMQYYNTSEKEMGVDEEDFNIELAFFLQKSASLGNSVFRNPENLYDFFYYLRYYNKEDSAYKAYLGLLVIICEVWAKEKALEARSMKEQIQFSEITWTSLNLLGYCVNGNNWNNAYFY